MDLASVFIAYEAIKKIANLQWKSLKKFKKSKKSFQAILNLIAYRLSSQAQNAVWHLPLAQI